MCALTSLSVHSGSLCVFIPGAYSSPVLGTARRHRGAGSPRALTLGPGASRHGPAGPPLGALPAARSQWQLKIQTRRRVSAAPIGCPGGRGRGSAGGGVGAVRERRPCCGSCGGAGAPINIASCRGSPSTSPASAGEAREEAPGASPDPSAPRRDGLGRRRSSLEFVTQKCFSIGRPLASMKFLVRYLKIVFNIEDDR